jgi:hypothetical protein
VDSFNNLSIGKLLPDSERGLNLMGRGLSELQRWILTEACKRPRLHYADVLHHYFGFPVRPGADRLWYVTGLIGSEYGESTWEGGGTLRTPNCQRFDPAAIGLARYRSAKVALGRSCRRLEQRGLVTCIAGAYSRWAGVEATDKGRELSVYLFSR